MVGMVSLTASVLTLFLASQSTIPTTPVDLKGGQTLEGKPASIEIKKSKATVLLFIAYDCPVANRYAPEIRRIYSEYKEKGVGFYRIYIRDMDWVEEVVAHGEDFKLEFPAVLDPKLELVKACGARVTPEAVVMGPDSKMLYRGRIDDQNIEHGRIREGYRRDLRVALDEVLAGKKVSVPEAAAVGCFIPGSGE